jgi:DNA-binding response OmpR family regulator
VVEDEPLIALDIEDALNAAGASVTVARSLDEARLRLADMAPDLVLLDVVLPDGRSFDLARELLALGLPFAFLTGYDHGIPDTFRAVRVVEKPFSTDALLGVVGMLSASPRPSLPASE